MSAEERNPGESERYDACGVSEEDLRAALEDMKTYVDVTEEDLRKIFVLAVRHARERTALAVTVRECMTTPVVTTTAETCLGEVIRLLSEHGISGLPVVDESRAVVGVVTEADVLSMTGLKKEHTFRDMMHRLLGGGSAERTPATKAGDVMSAPVITVGGGASLHSAAKLMEAKRIGILPVVGPGKVLEGVLTRGDIVRVIGKRWQTISSK